MPRSDLLADGACITCLGNGVTAFPLDPAYHLWRTGHVPALQPSPECRVALRQVHGRELSHVS